MIAGMASTAGKEQPRGERETCDDARGSPRIVVHDLRYALGGLTQPVGRRIRRVVERVACFVEPRLHAFA